MKVKLFLLTFAASLMQLVQADLLLWQVGDDAPSNYTYASFKSNTSKSYDGSVYVDSTFSGSTVAGSDVDKTVLASGITIGANIGTDYASKYFFIELYGDDDELVGRSSIASANDLNAYIRSASEMGAEFSGANSWTGGTWTTEDVPEPTSGLLLLMGAALLGLRRKKLA